VSYFLNGNLVEGRPQYTASPASMFTPQESAGRKLFRLVDQPFDTPPVRTTGAEQAYEEVLAQAGAVAPVRDAVDARLVRQVGTRAGRIINSQREVGGWPEYRNAASPRDTDEDGIPDDWEIAHGLNPRDQRDAGRDHGGYTHIEEYLNDLAQAAIDRARAAGRGRRTR
jgi:hypothetical protein